MSDPLTFFATASRGLEPLLARELAALGATGIKEQGGGVAFTGDLAVAYRACLWSRLASRVLLPLARFPLTDAEALYQGARAIDWTDVFDVKTTFAIEVAGRSAAVTHTHYAGLKVKDAIADTFRGKTGERPSVDTDKPQVLVHLHLDKDHAQVALDLSGESLHRRGYRRAGAEAPLKENLAAAILLRAGWPEFAARGAPLVDPMCGSGTLVIEAALMACDVAPGLERERFGFAAWLDHQPKLWRELREEAAARATAGRARELPVLCGYDVDAAAIRAARDNAQRAGFAGRIRFEEQDLSDARPPPAAPGLLVTNPPYGERLGAEADVIKIHSLLGAMLKAHFPGWHAAVFTGRPDLGPRIGLRARDMYSLYNGPLPCKLLLFDVPGTAAGMPAAPGAAPAPALPVKPGGDDFANRLQKNLKHLGKWARRLGVSCYRLYDADLPDYAVAVDVYETVAGGARSHSGPPATERHVHVQEYAAPKTVDPIRAEKRLRDALSHIQQMLEVPAANLHYKLRRSQRPGAQYGRQAETGRVHEIDEHGCRLLVNFEDYLDTGLFLDHRALRRRIQHEASGKRFLNLFCYTGSATAHAARGGASQTLSIDMSNTYLDWAQRNLQLNGVRTQTFDYPPSRWPAHALLRADCLKWLDASAKDCRPTSAARDSRPASAARDGRPASAASVGRHSHADGFDLILCDPPTFSHSKKMEGVLDTQRDHPTLIRQCAALLAPNGTLYFSTNRRGFKLDPALAAEFAIEDLTAQTLDEDFKRPPPTHRCWAVRHA